jgi:hypothetical protein
MKLQALTISDCDNEITATPDSFPIMPAVMIPARTQTNLLRMFRDPYILEKEERAELVQELRDAVSRAPEIPELRVLLGMTLCVNFDAQAALEELQESVRLSPNHFIARLKLGELLMRLRICSKAAEETQIAAKLASNSIQSELARRQATAIRTMQREGIERGGYGKVLSVFHRVSRFFTRTKRYGTTVALNTR